MYTHYHEDVNTGRVTLFNIGQCPECGGLITEPNAATGCDSPDTYDHQGLTKFTRMPPAVDVSDEGDYRCDDCEEESR